MTALASMIVSTMLSFGGAEAQDASNPTLDTPPVAAKIPAVSLGRDVVDPISTAIADNGLAAAEARLALGAKGDATKLFALGAVRFLRAVESGLQTRWRYDIAALPFAPILRLELPANPKPAAWSPTSIETLFSAALAQLSQANEALLAAEEALNLAPEEPIALTIALDDLWFDVDGDGARSGEWESAAILAGGAGLTLLAPGDQGGPVVRFDTADLSWLRAYTHLLSAVAELVLSMDPTTHLARVYDSETELSRTVKTSPSSFADVLDQAAPLVLMLQAVPNRERTRAALGHLEAMIAENRVFWTRLAEEDDNVAEWIPNPRQVSAIDGVRVSMETAKAWVAVLQEFDKLLKGELLAPHPRYGPTADGQSVGVNVRRALLEPQTFDPLLWAQGAAAAPYLEIGPVMTGEAMQRFAALVSGQALTFAIWFN